MLVFTEPSAQRWPSPAEANTLRKAVTSMGSPSAVPVPCASTYETVAGSVSDTASASATTSACPSALGAVKPNFREPSLLTADPRITAWITSPSASASSRRLSTTTPAPLPGTVPEALSSNARQCPSGETTPPSSYR
ncbi:hypothetical protein ASE41_09670 [Streptomyces sp. Root264]|nr:hypothetical protein ASE41_09670 [Streptomyces sp. Root264]